MSALLNANLASAWETIERRNAVGWTDAEVKVFKSTLLNNRRTTAALPSFAFDDKQLEKIVKARVRKLEHFSVDTKGRRELWLAAARGVWQEGKTSFAVADALGISAALVRQILLRLRKTAADLEAGRRLPRRKPKRLSPQQYIRRAIWSA
jgi:hypothetical protein